VPSMSRQANYWDNAVAEPFFATLKNEEVSGVYRSKGAAYVGIANYNPRLLQSDASALGTRQPLTRQLSADADGCVGHQPASWRPTGRDKFKHPFLVIKRLFGFAKTRYRGLEKNVHRLFVTCALTNLYLVRRRLMRLM
jgi:transposase InsO family protein